MRCGMTRVSYSIYQRSPAGGGSLCARFRGSAIDPHQPPVTHLLDSVANAYFGPCRHTAATSEAAPRIPLQPAYTQIPIAASRSTARPRGFLP